MKYQTAVILALFLLLCISAQAQTLPSTIFFVGASADPNERQSSATVDVGGAKLTGASTYLGVVAHLGSKHVTPFQISTRIQFHVAQKLMTFHGWPVFWTGEVGPDFAAATPATATSGTNIGYAVGSGPMVSIPIRKSVYIAPHAEITKGSLQDLGWRGGILIIFGGD